MSGLRLGLVAVLLCGVAWPALAQPGRDELRHREAQNLGLVRESGYKNLEALVELARVREQLGWWQLAIDTWSTIRTLYAQQPLPPHDASAPEPRCGTAAGFYIHRLERKRNLAASPATPPSAETRMLMYAAARNVGHKLWGARDGQVDTLIQLDMDGDLADEVLVIGKYGRLGERIEQFVGLAKWEGQDYRIVWSAGAQDFHGVFPAAVECMDYEGQGWKTVHLGFEPETDNVAMLQFNGEQALVY